MRNDKVMYAAQFISYLVFNQCSIHVSCYDSHYVAVILNSLVVESVLTESSMPGIYRILSMFTCNLCNPIHVWWKKNELVKMFYISV